jgi:hypothetical protein
MLVQRHVRELAPLEPGHDGVEREREQPQPSSFPAASLDVELFGDRRLVADQLRHLAEVGKLVAEGDQPEPVLRLVRDPDVALGQRGQVLAQLLERRLRVEQVPDEDARDQNGPLGS